MLTLVNNPVLWNTALATLPLAHVLQTWEWGQFKARHGWTPRYMLWQNDDGKPCAAALILRRQLGRFPLRIFYVPKGPALDYGDANTLDTVLADLEALARRERAIFIKIDPDVEAEAGGQRSEAERSNLQSPISNTEAGSSRASKFSSATQ